MSELGFDQIALIAITALAAQILGGVTGYGTGLILPLILVPMVGASATVPIIALSSLITNPIRVIAFRNTVNWRMVGLVTLAALPGVALGSYGFTLLSGINAQRLIGIALIALLFISRYMRRIDFRLSGPFFLLTALGFGVIMGGTSGSGVFLLSLLMAAGISGTGVIATDAAASTLLGIAKVIIFVIAGSYSLQLVVLAGLIGIMATPGVLTAKWLLRRFSPNIHNAVLDVSVATGAAIMIVGAF